MTRAALPFAVLGMFLCCSSWADERTPLLLDSKIPLGDVIGRIDHMAIDIARHRLFVAELENDTVGVVDLNTGKVVQIIPDMRKPQGVGYVPSTDTLYVANGGDGWVRLFQGADHVAAGRIYLGDDADNVRVDRAANQVVVSYTGGLGVIDTTRRTKVADIPLKAPPESFQLDSRSNLIFVNDPAGQAIVVVDRATGMQVRTWSTGNGRNVPMALNEASDHVLVAFRNPAKLGVFAMPNGAPVTNVDTCSDADDMFVDAKRNRVYVSCGDGFLDVFDAQAGAYQRLARIATVRGARTSLYVPELDRLFVAVRTTSEEPAAIWVFRPTP